MQGDDERLIWLERMALQKDGILLHGEIGNTGRLGLGLRYPNGSRRTLREAIDEAMGLQRPRKGKSEGNSNG